ncbi:MAG: NB-ARC domain-containing protein [Cyanobacteria bacterium J06636_16]
MEDALKLLDTLLPPGSLNTVKTLVFRESWDGKGYAAIAESAGYDADYIKIAAAQLWKALSQALGEKVTKKNFRSLLRQKFWTPDVPSPTSLLSPTLREAANASTPQSPPGRLRQHPKALRAGFANTPSLPETNPHQSRAVSTRCDWSTAPDVSTFLGRTEELKQIHTWIGSGDCRLIALLGMGGIGKTSLATKVARDLQGAMDYIFWRSLRNAPPLDKLLTAMVAFLTDQTVTDGSMDVLLEQLRSHRCLLILDNAETLLKSGLTGHYRPGYEGYGDLFRIIGETPHQSCLLLTSREKPPEIAILEGTELSVKTRPLQGSLEVTLPLIQRKGLIGSLAEQRLLCQQYNCSPLALKIVATSIQDLFAGQITDFLEAGAISFNGIRRLLDQHWQRLSLLEQTILRWLAINRTWTSVAELHTDIVPAVSKGQLLEALESLTWRALVEQHGSRYCLQPVVLEYITDNLISQVFQELVTPASDAALTLLSQYALLKTTTEDYICATQAQLILAPITTLLQQTLSTPERLRCYLQALLNRLRQSSEAGLGMVQGAANGIAGKQETAPSRSPDAWMVGAGYGAGNILNLAIQLGLDLTEFDVSCLTVRHADLRETPLHSVNFAYAHFDATVFRQNFGSIMAVTYSPNGKFVATAGTAGHIRIWRTVDGQLHQFIQGSQTWIWSLAYSPDGRYLACADHMPQIRIWDVTTRHCLKVLALPETIQIIFEIAFSPDGTTLAIGSNHSTVVLYELATEQMRLLEGHQHSVTSVAFSPNQPFLASGSHDHTMRLWDLRTGDTLQVWDGHQNMVRTVAFSPDGTWLASGGDDCTIWRWHLETGQCLGTFEGHGEAICAICISPDGKTLISGSEDSTIRHWDVSQGQCLKTLQGHEGAILTIALSPDGNTLASSSLNRRVRVWDLHSGNSLYTAIGYTDYAYGLTFSPDGQTLAAGSSNSLVRLWDWQTATYTQTLQGHHNWVWSTAWSPDGQRLASCGLDHSAKIWRVASGKCIETLTGHESGVTGVAWHPNGHLLATTGQDSTIRLWESQSGQCQRIMAIPQSWITAVCWDATGKYLISGSSDHLIRVWDPNTGSVVQCLTGHQGLVASVLCTPDGRLLISACLDGTVKVWDMTQGCCLQTLRHAAGNVFAIAASSDGRLLASAGGDAEIYLWDTATWDCVHTITEHTADVSGLAFHPQYPILASGSEDETIHLWDIAHQTRLSTLKGQRPYEGMDITGVTGLTDAEITSLVSLGAIAHT